MISRVLVGAVTVLAAILVPSARSAAANIPAAPTDAASPLGGGGVGDVAPFSLESSGAGSDYTRGYIPGQTRDLSPPASGPAPSPTVPSLPSAP